MMYDLNNIVCIKTNKTIYRDGNNLIKIFEDNIETSKILNEALCQQRVLENTDINIPNLFEVTKINGKWAIVMEYVDGITLEQYLETHPDKIDKILELLISTQLKVLNNNVPLLNRTKDVYANKLNNNKDLDDHKKEILLKRLDNEKNSNKLCHGDLSLSNVVIKKDGSIWILDWSHASQGNIETDVARTYLTMLFKDKNVAEKYLTMFTEKTKISPDLIKKWLPIIAGAELKPNKESNSTKEFIDSIEYE